MQDSNKDLVTWPCRTCPGKLGTFSKFTLLRHHPKECNCGRCDMLATCPKCEPHESDCNCQRCDLFKRSEAAMKENEEVKNQCCGKPEECTEECPEKGNNFVPPAPVEPELDPKPLIFVPEGLEVNLDIGTNALSEKLAALFNKEKVKRDLEALEKEPVITGSDGSINLGDYRTVALPNGMTVQVHKDSHKAKQEDMNRLMAEAEEMDCSDEDEEGNPLPLAEAPSYDPAKSEYKAGQLRGLKAKYHPKDDAGAQAQARLADREKANEAVRERFRKEDEKYGKPESAIEKLAHIRSQIKNLEKEERALKKQEVEEIRRSMLIDWSQYDDRLADATKQLGNIVPIELDSGWTVYVPAEQEFDKVRGNLTAEENPEQVKAKLERIVKAAYPVPNKAGEARAERDAQVRAKVEYKRALEAVEQERQRRLTDDIIRITPIENPSPVRRVVRTVRRAWKRLLTWWLL